LIEIINKQLLLQLVGYLCYWQMGFNSVFKGLNKLQNARCNDKDKTLHLVYIMLGTEQGNTLVRHMLYFWSLMSSLQLQ